MAWDLDRRAASRPIASQPRAHGQVQVSTKLCGRKTVLDRLHQHGSAKALFPREPGLDLTVVLLNTAGGVTGGDRFRTEADAARGTSLTLATQTAERAYRAQPGETGRLENHLNVRSAARLDWLAQETILYQGARLDRRLTADVAPDATFLAVETLIFGRTAMGERLSDITLLDTWRIRRGGDLVYADALRLDGDAEEILGGRGTLNGARALSSLVFVSPEAAYNLARLRHVLPPTAGASLIREGVLTARLLAEDCFTLRRSLIPVLACLRTAPLPKVWTI
ncbi:MAG: urease accessory protein UreD [Pseudomonadota bacterium]